MIKTETEYQATIQRIEQSKKAASKQFAQLQEQGLTAEQIDRVMEPAATFQAQIVEEVHWYERIKAGDLDPIHNLNQIGQILISLRIAGGLTQKQLAGRLNVPESVVTQDERNDYHGISVERAQRILEALGGQATVVVSKPRPSPKRELAAH